uniref:Small ribosomal subunit protein uS2c n=1 Tax=Chloromonas radiata TaxID=47907 RepID=A0A0S2ICH3_9CHLO|nr:ribosomal protein S2 [Chloromonas radiata]
MQSKEKKQSFKLTQSTLNSTKEKQLKNKQSNQIQNKLVNNYAAEPLIKAKEVLKEKKNYAKSSQNINKFLLPTVEVGDFCELNVTAVGPNGVGIDEFSYGYSILIPNAKLGETVKAQIIKINLKKAKYAIAKITPSATSTKLENSNALPVLTKKENLIEAKQNLNVGDILTVKLNRIVLKTDSTCIGIVNSNLPTKESEKKRIFKELIIPLNNLATVGQEITIKVTKLKLKYGFAKILSPETLSLSSKNPSACEANNLDLPSTSQSKLNKAPFVEGKKAFSTAASKIPEGNFNNKNKAYIKKDAFDFGHLTKGSKITLTIPKTTKKYAKHLVLMLKRNTALHLNDSVSLNAGSSDKNLRPQFAEGYTKEVLFLKNGLGAKSGDKVRVKFTQIGSTFAIGKVVKIAPISLFKKKIKIRKNLNEMLLNGMHFGEKVVKCQARMRNFIWNRKKSVRNYNRAPAFGKDGSQISNSFPLLLSQSLGAGANKKDFLFSTPSLPCEARLLPYHPAKLNNSKGAAPYINNKAHSTRSNTGDEVGQIGTGVRTNYAASKLRLASRSDALLIKEKLLEKNALIKKGRHLINLLKTRRCLNVSLNQLTKYAAKGRTFLFVGTKKPAAGLIARAALFSKTSFFVNTRWLGGMLTNWKTIIKSISKIRPILKEKQKVIANILQKRAKIQNRLIKKVLSLRKKSKILIKKGKQLILNVPSRATSKKTISNSTPSASFQAASPNTPYQKSTPSKISGEAAIFKEEVSKTSSPFGEAAYKEPLLKEQQTGGDVAEGRHPVAWKLLEKLNFKRKELFERGQLLLQTRQSLLKKQNELKENTLHLKESGFLIANKYKVLLNQLTGTHQKLYEIRLLFLLNKELRNIKKLAKEQGKNQYTLSYPKFRDFFLLRKKEVKEFALRPIAGEDNKKGFSSSKNFWLIPNPPQSLLNKILVTINNISDLTSKSSANFSVKEKNNSSYPSRSDAKKDMLETGSKFNKSIILTKLLSKFSLISFLPVPRLEGEALNFLPYLRNFINRQQQIISLIEKKMVNLKTILKNFKNKLMQAYNLNNKINTELELIKKKYISEQQIIRVLRRKLKRHEAEKKLLQFLPKLRYLPTPKSQISLAIQILMKRFVDPKMKYPMDLIYEEKLRKNLKKWLLQEKKWQRLETYFGGIANMTKLRKTQISKNVAIIIGQQEEMNAVRECKKLGIKMFHIVDTNCNPGLADHFIPSNDDSRNSIKYLLTKIVTRIRLAQKMRLRFKLKAKLEQLYS